MTRFYTRRGDGGRSLMGTKKLEKTGPFFEAIGILDELNSWLGVCRAEAGKLKSIAGFLKSIQEDLFVAQAELAAVVLEEKPKKVLLSDKISALESIIAEINPAIPEITKFIIPGGSKLSAHLDYARTLARRAERTVLKYLSKPYHSNLPGYLNRLSSALFALARLANFKLKIKEDNPKY